MLFSLRLNSTGPIFAKGFTELTDGSPFDITVLTETVFVGLYVTLLFENCKTAPDCIKLHA